MSRCLSRSLVALAIVVCLVRPASAAWALEVAWAQNYTAGAGLTQTFTYGSAVSAGALLVCFAVGANQVNGVLTGIVDTSLNTWQQFGAGSPVTTPLGHAWSGWYAMNVAGATPTLTATFTGSSTNRGLLCASYTGIATASAFDVGAGQGQTNPGTATDAVTTGAASTTAANDLVVAATITQNAQTVTAGTGFTDRFNGAWGTALDVVVEDMNVGSPTSVAGTFTVTNAAADFQSLMGAFKEPAAAGGCNGGLLLTGAGKC